MKQHNFGSGPAILPEEVFQEASMAVKDFNQQGLSILEISHRSDAFQSILNEAVALTRSIYQIDEAFEVLFLSGGASSQFFMTAMNLLGQNETASFLDTGSWSTKAIKEAQLFGNVQVVASSKDSNYTYIPKRYEISSNTKYLHITSNNTIYGTQMKAFPNISVPLVADMSSDIFSRPIDWTKFDLVYGGAQKNLGPAGTTLVIVRKSALGKVERSIPTMLDYRTHIKRNSAFNTPPVFPIYVAMLNLRWLQEQGGIAQMNSQSHLKATTLYEALDASPCFKPKVNEEDRSIMNVTFELMPAYLPLQDTFLEWCKAANCVGLKGHRTVGGFRASIYNAMPAQSVEVLTDVIEKFSIQFG